MLASARQRAWRMAGVCALLPARGGFVGRAFTPAAWGLAAAQGFRDDASIVPYGCGARRCRALQDIFAANRQCTPPSAPCGASTSPCRGGFGGTAAYKASPARGGVAPGDGGVRHLAVPIPFRGGANLPGGRERPPGKLAAADGFAAGEIARPTSRPWAGGSTGAAAAGQGRRRAGAGIAPCPGGGGLPFPVLPPVCPVL